MQTDREDEAPDVAAVRREARAFLSGRLPRRDEGGRVQVMGAGSDDLEEGRAFLRLLGPWAVPSWPESAGGLGLTPPQAAAFRDELSRFEAPDLYPFMVGLSLVGPTVLEHGTEEQQARWLPSIRNGEEIWCQLFSEPGAGSDLAALSCRAVRDGELWHVSGQKVWSSRAHYSAWGLLLARTDPSVPKHAGITCFGVDFGQPGVEVRPIVQVNGDTHFNEVFLDDVRVADRDRIGGLGAGWRVAMTTLTHERQAIGQGSATLSADQILKLVRRSGRTNDTLVRQRVAELVTRIRIAEMNKRRKGRPPQMGSADKLWMSDTLKAAADLALQIAGPAAVAGEERDEWRTLFLTGPSLSIRGGTDEVMRNILGERVLGLPPEPRVDKDKPFNG